MKRYGALVVMTMLAGSVAGQSFELSVTTNEPRVLAGQTVVATVSATLTDAAAIAAFGLELAGSGDVAPAMFLINPSTGVNESLRLGATADATLGSVEVVGGQLANLFNRNPLIDPSSPIDLFTVEIDTAVGSYGELTLDVASQVNAIAAIAAYESLTGPSQVFAQLSEITVTPAVVTISCPADSNGDGLVNGLDFGAWLGAFNANSQIADVNLDGTINGLDFGAWLGAFNAGCD